MGGGHPASIKWFVFASEPTYTVTHGPQQDFRETFTSLAEQFRAQAIQTGCTELYFRECWPDGRAYESAMEFFLSSRVVFSPGDAQDDLGNYYRFTLSPPAALAKHAGSFEAMSRQTLPESVKTPLEQISRILRQACTNKHWIAFSFVDCS